jgi:hypothetical protein
MAVMVGGVIFDRRYIPGSDIVPPTLELIGF